MAFIPGPAYRLGGAPSFAPIQYDVDPAETFLKGALVYFDTGANEYNVKKCGADPALILGIAAHGAVDGVESGKVLVFPALPDLVFRMKGSSNPALANLQLAYGVTIDANGLPTVDLTDTTNTRVRVIDVDLTNNDFYVIFQAANSQADAIAS